MRSGKRVRVGLYPRFSPLFTRSSPFTHPDGLSDMLRRGNCLNGNGFHT